MTTATSSGTRTLGKSVLTSLGTSALDVGLFALASTFVGGLALLLARWLTSAVGALANFAINRRWAFAASDAEHAKLSRQAARYGCVALVSITLGTASWWLMRQLTPWDPRLLHVLSLALVWLVFTFPALRGWVFSRRKAE